MKNLDDDLWRNFCATCRNLWYYPTEQLVAVAASDDSEENRLPCVAELFVREFLKPRRAAKEINAVLSGGELVEFHRSAPPDFFMPRQKGDFWREHDLWRSQSDFSRKCMTAVRYRLIELCEEIDGFIPVFDDTQAFFIPFHFVVGPGGIEDRAGQTVDEWQAPYEELFGAEPKYRCVVHCDQSGLSKPLTGRSLMLPLYLAYLQKTGELKYNHLRLIATGAVAAGKLAAVDMEKKAAGIDSWFDEAYLFFPESEKYCPKPREIPLPAKLPLAELGARMRRDIEAKGLIVPNLQDAMKRLEVISADREGNCGRWEDMLDRLENNLQAISTSRAPTYYLLGLMLKSSILCHMGRTNEALKFNRKAQVFAREHGFIQKLRRLEVEQLVGLQDLEKFELITRLAKPLGKDIESLGDPDLLMRYYGTIGQAHCCGALAGVFGFDRDTAKKHLERALEYAYDLAQAAEADGAATEANKAVAEDNIARDLNYLFRWHVLFEPETEAAAEAYEKAESHIRCQLADYADFCERNRIFLKKEKAFWLYRRYLKCGIVPAEDPEDLLLPSGSFGWLRALTGKYVGALLAAIGKVEDAAKIFADSAAILREEKEPIMRFIQMTTLAEAYRSTGDAAYRDEALGLLDVPGSAYSASSGAWKDFLTGKKDFPGLAYWY